MVDEESSNPLPLSITTTTARYAPTPLPLIFKLVRPLSCLSWQNVYTPSCTEEGSRDREKKKEEEKDGSRKRGRVSRQRIISMTSKGVVISRPFLSARVFLHESGCEWRLRATPVIVLIQPYPSNHLLLSFSPSPRSLFVPPGGGWPSRPPLSSDHPPPTPADPPKARLPEANEACERRV